MSLVRLLTSGKALMTLRDLPSAYRLRREGWLPKFGLGRDPFAAKETSAPAGAPLAGPATAVSVASGATARKSLWPWSGQASGENGKASLVSEAKTRGHAARDTRVPLQGELSLDTVKVVRNDLHGSDVDLVSRVQVAEKPYHQQVASNLISGANAAEQALDRLAERIVGAGTR